MKVRAHLRVAKTKGGRKPYRVQAKNTPSHEPLFNASGVALPTAAFALDLEIPDEAFKRAEQVIAEVVIPEEQLEICAEVFHAGDQ